MTTPVTEEDYTAYYEENYCHVRHIYVNNQYYYMTDENGYSVFDDSGNVKMTGKGTATITAKSTDGKAAAECKVTVSYAWWQWIIMFVLLGFLWY